MDVVRSKWLRWPAGMLVALGVCAGAAAQTSTTTYPSIGVACAGSGQLCTPPLDIFVSTTGLLQASYTASAGHCSNVKMRFLVDGGEVAASGFLAPGASTGTVDLGPVSPGQHTLGLQGEGEVGGCNSGTLGNWAGSATVTVGIAVRGSPVAVPGPGIVATTIAFLLGAFTFFLRRRARR